MIETLNLHKSLINLTIEIVIPEDSKEWRDPDAIEKILLKQRFHNLNNVNILMRMEKKHIITKRG